MNIKPKIPKYVEYLGTKKQPPHTLQLTHTKKTSNNQHKNTTNLFLFLWGLSLAVGPILPLVCGWDGYSVILGVF